MRKTLLLATALTLIAFTPARADLIFLNQGDLGAEGFGHDPRLITMQGSLTGNAPIETGSVTPLATGCCVLSGDAVGNVNPGDNKSNTPTVGALGWNTGSMVELAFNVAQTGQTGLTLQSMSFSLFTGTTLIDTFSLAAPFQITPAMAALDQGNGNGVLFFGLDAAQQARFTADVLAHGTGMFVGSAGSWGCPAGTSPSPTCMPANDGPDSLLAVTVPGPIVGAGIPGLIGACIGFAALARRRINRWRDTYRAVMH